MDNLSSVKLELILLIWADHQFTIDVVSRLFCLQLEEDVNEVLFALSSGSCTKEDCLPEAAQKLEKLLKFKHPEMSQSIVDAAKKVRVL